MRLDKFMDFLADADTKHKMILVIFVLAVMPAGIFFLLLNIYPSEEIVAYSGLYLVLLIIVLSPAASFFSDILVLRNIKKVNAYCRKAKQGIYQIPFDLPPEKGQENDFLRMKRNLYWMGQIIAKREAKLLDVLRELKNAQAKIVESIEYASLIQHSLLPSPRVLDDIFEDHFIWWEPRDVVGGDTYWAAKSREGYFAGVIDCTGHGVPGAFVTLIVHTLLEKIATAGSWNNPALVLQHLNQQMKAFLARNNSSPLVDDGFDAGLCFVNSGHDKMTFAGAGRPLFCGYDGKIHEIRGSRAGVAYSRVPEDTEYLNHTIEIQSGMRFYLATDGVTDQIGESNRLPFGKKKLKRLLSQTYSLPLKEQRLVLAESLEEYTGNESRRDDLTLLAFVPRM
ncbi:MAG: SpoIIE family protein phosphatase [Deltaproteobacteria bacterium]|nr:SpoIIE family protein phosphatase [Deltaproteobacteria bacterium]